MTYRGYIYTLFVLNVHSVEQSLAFFFITCCMFHFFDKMFLIDFDCNGEFWLWNVQDKEEANRCVAFPLLNAKLLLKMFTWRLKWLLSFSHDVSQQCSFVTTVPLCPTTFCFGIWMLRSSRLQLRMFQNKINLMKSFCLVCVEPPLTQYFIQTYLF